MRNRIRTRNVIWAALVAALAGVPGSCAPSQDLSQLDEWERSTAANDLDVISGEWSNAVAKDGTMATVQFAPAVADGAVNLAFYGECTVGKSVAVDVCGIAGGSTEGGGVAIRDWKSGDSYLFWLGRRRDGVIACGNFGCREIVGEWQSVVEVYRVQSEATMPVQLMSVECHNRRKGWNTIELQSGSTSTQVMVNGEMATSVDIPMVGDDHGVGLFTFGQFGCAFKGVP